MDNQHIQDGRATKNKSQSKVKTQSYNPIQTMAGLQLSQTSQPRHLMDIHQQEHHTSSQLEWNSSHNSTKKTQILFDITKTQTSMSSPPMKPFLHDFRKTTSQWLLTHPRWTTFFKQRRIYKMHFSISQACYALPSPRTDAQPKNLKLTKRNNSPRDFNALNKMTSNPKT